MTTIINGSSPSITFSDSTTQSTAALPLTGGTVTGGVNLATSSGNVGIGTTSPVRQLSIYNASAAWTSYQNSTTGTSSADGLLVGIDQNTAYVYSYESFPMVFGTNNTERMRIDSSGKVLIGTTTSSAGVALKVAGGIIGAIDVYNNTTASAANMFIDSSGFFARSTSSLKYKTDVKDATHGLAEVLKLRPVTYKGKTDGNTVFGGLIAEEVDAVGLKEFVQYADDGSPDALAYGQMVSLCIKAIQELKAELDATKAEVAALKAGA